MPATCDFNASGAAFDEPPCETARDLRLIVSRPAPGARRQYLTVRCPEHADLARDEAAALDPNYSEYRLVPVD